MIAVAVLLCTPLITLVVIWLVEHWPKQERVIGSYLDMDKERREMLIGYERGRTPS